jgi:hypothetical protein
MFEKFDKIELGNSAVGTKLLSGRNVTTTTTFTGLNFGIVAGNKNNSYLNGKQDLSSCLNSTRTLNSYREKINDNIYESNNERKRDHSNSYCKKKVESARNSNKALSDHRNDSDISKENKVRCTKIKREIDFIT